VSEAVRIPIPLPWQIAPWQDKSPVLLLTGSAGGGKSRLAAEKVNGYCEKYPGSAWLIMRKAREWAGKSIVPFLRDSVIGPNVKFSKAEGTFTYPNGSTIYSGGMLDDKQRESVRSIGGAGGLDGAWLEEANAFTRQDFDEVLARIRHTAASWQQVILTTNPDAPSHWIHRDLILNGGAAVYYSHAADNPYNSPQYRDNLAKMQGVQALRLREGKWVQAEGVIYDGFSLDRHVCQRPLADFNRFELAMDEGYTNPAVILVVGIDSDDRIHVIDEFYETGVLQEQVIETALTFRKTYNARAAAVDAAAAGLIASLRNAGINASPQKGRVIDGITAVQNRLALAGDGRPRLTVDPRCVNLISEFQVYAWKPGRDEPIKQSDHALDALRYFIAGIGGNRAQVF
jgi:phage terminase large subunit